MSTRLDKYDNSWYNPGRSAIIRFAWFFISIWFVQCSWNPLSSLRIFLLRLFGAKIGNDVTIKPGVYIKYPWLLIIGNSVWIGENVWIDNLAQVTMADHVCISQGAYLVTGNHDFSKSTFDLMVKPIDLKEGVWIGAKSIVCPGVICQSHSILTVGSVARAELAAYKIYSGNPAVEVKDRIIHSS
jgi:putative colanic acid biosynthesis acetyltransferase WcaF